MRQIEVAQVTQAVKAAAFAANYEPVLVGGEDLQRQALSQSHRIHAGI
jgi:hypothetical protein